MFFCEIRIEDKNSCKDFGMGVHPMESGSVPVKRVPAPESKIPAGGTVKAKRFQESVLDGYLYGGDW